MVFGNKGDTSATGVAFTRNPANGEREFYGDYLVNAQGEDVVAGIRNTSPIADLKTVEGLEEAGAQLEEIFDVLENHFRDMCDIEFTIEQGKLWMLQTRAGKRTAAAALRIAIEMEKDDFEALCAQAAKLMEGHRGTFKVNARRSDKRYPMDSPAINMEMGAYLLEHLPGLKVCLLYTSPSPRD